MEAIGLLVVGLLAFCGIRIIAWRRRHLKIARSKTGSLVGVAAQALPPTAPLKSGVYLYIQRGPGARRAFELPLYGEVVIQRNPADKRTNPHVLTLDDPAISRDRHCRIAVQGRQHITLEDSSSNGTIVQGQYIKHAAVEIKIGQILLIGSTSIRVCDGLQMSMTTRMKP